MCNIDENITSFKVSIFAYFEYPSIVSPMSLLALLNSLFSQERNEETQDHRVEAWCMGSNKSDLQPGSQS